MKFLLLLKENENYKINLEFCVLFLISYLIIILMMKIMRIMRKIFVRIDFISFLSYIRQLVRFTRKDLQTITNVDTWGIRTCCHNNLTRIHRIHSLHRTY